jgi:hypothetical protein
MHTRRSASKAAVTLVPEARERYFLDLYLYLPSSIRYDTRYHGTGYRQVSITNCPRLSC